MYPPMTSNPLSKSVNETLISLPSPSSISAMWNFGSILGLCLGTQVITGLFLAMHFSADTSLAFSSVAHISMDVNSGWLLRMLHANGASMFFICLYLHAGRGVYFGSYLSTKTWSIGVVLLLLAMATAFMGYVLPWGQMSFWGATVITNLFSAIPCLGGDIVYWLWGGFAVDKATLTRFFALHFLVPFLMIAGVLTHLIFLHQSGSSNPLGLPSKKDMVMFHPYFSYKDLLGFIFYFFLLLTLSLKMPWLLGDPENFIPANPLVTPTHIQPEWYFLFAYAILRAVPNKLGGVAALVVAVLILLVLPHTPKSLFRGLVFYPLSQAYFWGFISLTFLLTWLGACPVEPPYVFVSQVFTVFYFIFFLSEFGIKLSWDYLLQ